MFKKLLIFITLVLSGLSIFLFMKNLLSGNKTKNIFEIELPTKDSRPQIKIKNIDIYVDVAKTNEEKGRGLSGRKSLKDDEGMLFVFENNSRPSFWMKDMLIPIDIIWISEGKVIAIDKNTPPPPPVTSDSELTLYTPPKGIDYVLEVKAGFCEKNAIMEEDGVEINIPNNYQ